MTMIFRFHLTLKNTHTLNLVSTLGCSNSIYSYLQGRSMRILNFQGIKKTSESKHSSVTVIDSLTQFAKHLGTLGTGPINVITMSAECL